MKSEMIAVLILIMSVPCIPAEVRHQDHELTILSATFGVREHRIDVTESVRSLQSHGVILLRAPWALGTEDPAPNRIKDVEIQYAIDGTSKKLVFNQNQNIILVAEPHRLVIVSARYGLADRRVDVTEALRARMTEDGALRVKSFWSLGLVDPAAGSVKDVEIVYIDFGVPKLALFKQNQDIILPRQEP